MKKGIKSIVSILLATMLVLSSLTMVSFALEPVGDTSSTNSIVDIEIETIKLIYEFDGYWDYAYDAENYTFDYEKEFFRYYAYLGTTKYTVVMEDGTRYESDEYGSVDIDGMVCCPQIIDNQSYENQWQIGLNEVTISLMDYTSTYYFEVIETPIESMTLTPVRDLIKDIDIAYYTEYIDFNTEIIFKDGTTFTGLLSDIETQLSKYALYSDERMTDEYTCTGTVNFLGYKTEYIYKFIDNPYEELTISGKNELIINLHRKDGTVDVLTPVGFYLIGGGTDYVMGKLDTDKASFYFRLGYYYDTTTYTAYENRDITLYLGNMKSNTLEVNNWYYAQNKIPSMLVTVELYHEKICPIAYEREFYSLKKANATDLINLAVSLQYFYNYEMGYDSEKMLTYVLVDTTTASQAVAENFNITDIDPTQHIGYDDETGKIKVYVCDGWSSAGNEKASIEFAGENWIAERRFQVNESEKVVTKVTINEDFQVVDILIYYIEYEGDASADTVNGWVEENGKWAFYENGIKVVNQWRKDSVGWCYLGADGFCITSKWINDAQGWCYLNANGHMATNKWVKDSVSWCYVGSDGYCVTNKWVKDSIGWCYLGSDGRMVTNRWVKDSVGWCYVGSDGYCVTNDWQKDSKGWCYLGADGRMVTSKWIKDNGNWYYLDLNGYMVTGTKVIDGKTYTFKSNGVWVA